LFANRTHGLEHVPPSISESVMAWIMAPNNLAANRIVMMLPANGMAYKVANNTNAVPYGNITGLPKAVAPSTKDGYMTRPQVCAAALQQTVIVSTELVIAYTVNNGTIIFSDTSSTLYAKRGFAAKNNLYGIGITALNDDDVSNVCKGGAFPFLSAISMYLC
jgi:hypothetical protein